MPKPEAERLPVRAPVYGGRFMAVTGHSASTLAALTVHRKGGSVVDAAIAGSAALATVLGQATTIGGDCFALYHDAKTGKTVGLNASGVAPAAATPEVFKDGMKVHGPLACVVPGLVKAWDELHRRYGKLEWKELFDEAIRIADGHPVPFIMATRIDEVVKQLQADPGCREVFLSGGRPIALGDIMKQPALARSLREIQSGGAAAYYTGALGKRIAAGFKQAGGLITEQDLASYAPLWVEPVSTMYRGHRVSVMPPNSCGSLLLLQLMGLSAIPSETLAQDATRAMGYQMTAMKEAFRLGTSYITDPYALPDAVTKLLSPEISQQMQTAVRAMKGGGKVPGSGGTACVMAGDRDGNLICIVQSIYNGFGSMYLQPETGILFNNRMQDFDPKPGKPTSVGPGRRPFHTLCPIMVHRDGRPRFALASPGGISQTLTGAQILTELLDRGRDVAESVDAPRWCNRKGGDFLIEPSLPEAFVPALAAMGHECRRAGDPYFFGSAKAIEVMGNGTLAGAGDFRREAFALGW